MSDLLARLAADEKKFQVPLDRLHETYRARLATLDAATSPARYPHRSALVKEEMQVVGTMNNGMRKGAVFAIENLEAGWHPFTLEFRETADEASFQLRWSSAAFKTRAIEPLEPAGPLAD